MLNSGTHRRPWSGSNELTGSTITIWFISRLTTRGTDFDPSRAFRNSSSGCAWLNRLRKIESRRDYANPIVSMDKGCRASRNCAEYLRISPPTSSSSSPVNFRTWMVEFAGCAGVLFDRWARAYFRRGTGRSRSWNAPIVAAYCAPRPECIRASL